MERLPLNPKVDPAVGILWRKVAGFWDLGSWAEKLSQDTVILAFVFAYLQAKHSTFYPVCHSILMILDFFPWLMYKSVSQIPFSQFCRCWHHLPIYHTGAQQIAFDLLRHLHYNFTSDPKLNPVMSCKVNTETRAAEAPNDERSDQKELLLGKRLKKNPWTTNTTLS